MDEKEEIMMEQTSTSGMSRRQLFGMAGLGALILALPTPLRAELMRKYPTLQAKLQEYLAGRKAAGIVIAIGHGNEAPQIIKGGKLGFNRDAAVDKHSLFRIYSMTKPVTGIAAMMLVEDGKIKLDQPIADFLPEFAQMKVLTDPDNSMNAVASETQITLRHLLTHTAGLGYNIVNKGPIKQAYEQAGLLPGQVTKLPIPGLGGGNTVGSLQKFSTELAKMPLVYEPGTKWSYSVSLDLLGHLIAVVSGMSFEAFLQKRIFDPLKMTSTYWQVPRSEINRFTDNYGLFQGALVPLDPAAQSIYLDKPAFAFGGAGLVSSAHDYDRFLHALMNYGELEGVRILNSETAKLAMSNLLPQGADKAGTWIADAGFGAGGVVGRGGQDGSFGWGGAAGTNAFVSTKRRIRATGMIQYMPADQQDFQRSFPTWVLADLMAMAEMVKDKAA